MVRPSDPPPPPLPWLLPYREDPSSAERYAKEPHRTVLRPVVDVSLAATYPMDSKLWALVDSGSEHTLASPGLARAIGLDLGSAFRELALGIGGDTQRFRFMDVIVRLHRPEGSVDEYFEWEAEVGFGGKWRAPWQVVLGQVGFLDQFTVTMHRHAQALAIEPLEVFDRRHGTVP